MKRKNIIRWIIVLIFIILSLLFLREVGAYSEFGSPTEFGNATTTTCWIGGDNGIVNCTGNADIEGNVTSNYFIGNGSQLTGIETDINENELNVNSSDYWDGLDVVGDILFSDLSPSNIDVTNYNVTANWFKGLLDWNNLENYPASCPEDTYLTQLGDSVTCTGIETDVSDIWVNESGDTMTGYLNLTSSNDVCIDGGNCLSEASTGSYTQSKVGKFRITSTGTKTITGTGFHPDMVEFHAQASVEDYDIEESGGRNTDTTDNVVGSMYGYAFDNGIGIDQQGIMSGGSGNSINSIREQSSSSKAITLTYGGQNGGEVGSVQAKVISFDSDGFTINVTEVNLDESGVVITYKTQRGNNASLEATDVSDDGSLIKEAVTDINFGDNLNVTDDGDGSVIVNANEGITGNYTNGNCWKYYSGGIVTATNCISI